MRHKKINWSDPDFVLKKKCFITPQKFSQVATSLMSKLQASVCLIHSTLSLWLSDHGIGVRHISRKGIPGCLKVRTVFLLNTRKYSLRSLAHTCPATNAIASGNVYTVRMAVKCKQRFFSVLHVYFELQFYSFLQCTLTNAKYRRTEHFKRLELYTLSWSTHHID